MDKTEILEKIREAYQTYQDGDETEAFLIIEELMGDLEAEE